jgi:hypothetical protein
VIDAIQIGIDGLGDLTTLVVVGIGTRNFAKRLAASLRRRGIKEVEVNEPGEEALSVKATEEDLMSELLRRLRADRDQRQTPNQGD